MRHSWYQARQCQGNHTADNPRWDNDCCFHRWDCSTKGGEEGSGRDDRRAHPCARRALMGRDFGIPTPRPISDFRIRVLRRQTSGFGNPVLVARWRFGNRHLSKPPTGSPAFYHSPPACQLPSAPRVISVLREQFFVRPRKQGQSTPLTLWDSPCFRWCSCNSRKTEQSPRLLPFSASAVPSSNPPRPQPVNNI